MGLLATFTNTYEGISGPFKKVIYTGLNAGFEVVLSDGP